VAFLASKWQLPRGVISARGLVAQVGARALGDVLDQIYAVA
jgi:hypothetical protein